MTSILKHWDAPVIAMYKRLAAEKKARTSPTPTVSSKLRRQSDSSVRRPSKTAAFNANRFTHLLTAARVREAANPDPEQSGDWDRTPGEQRGAAFAAMVERAAAVRDGRDPLPRIEAPRQGVRRVRGADLVSAMKAIGGLKSEIER